MMVRNTQGSNCFQRILERAVKIIADTPENFLHEVDDLNMAQDGINSSPERFFTSPSG
ncbi:hypothetical protein AB8880_07510 [Alphaproteobacteria bacterium LSUCC0684]